MFVINILSTLTPFHFLDDTNTSVVAYSSTPLQHIQYVSEFL